MCTESLLRLLLVGVVVNVEILRLIGTNNGLASIDVLQSMNSSVVLVHGCVMQSRLGQDTQRPRAKKQTVIKILIPTWNNSKT